MIPANAMLQVRTSEVSWCAVLVVYAYQVTCTSPASEPLARLSPIKPRIPFGIIQPNFIELIQMYCSLRYSISFAFCGGWLQPESACLYGVRRAAEPFVLTKVLTASHRDTCRRRHGSPVLLCRGTTNPLLSCPYSCRT